MGIAALESRRTLHRSELRQIGGETDQQILAKIDVGDFTSTELHHCFYTIAFLEKANRMVLLEFVVVIVGVGPELQLLHLDHVLFLLGFVLFFLLLVLPLAVVHRFGDRRFGGRRYDDQVETHFLCFAHSNERRHYFDSAVREHRPDFTSTNRLIHILTNARLSGRETSGRIHQALRS